MKLEFKIGNIKIEGGICLGPMAGVTDLPFRILCREQGCSLVCTEMVSAKAVLYGNRNTAGLIKTVPSEHPLALQLFGSDPDIVAEIASRMSAEDFDIIDFNMGCPMPKIVNNGEGSGLMLKPKLAGEILEKLVRAAGRPVTVKIRKGFDDKNINAVEMAKIAESAGVSAIAVHGRTREQYYTGIADWDIIRQVKDAVKIPVIGNGDIGNGQDALRMLKETGCDGIMLARAAQGNPWIFKNIREYMEKGSEPEKVSGEELYNTVIRHLDMQIETDGEYLGLRQMRKHITWYTHGRKGSSALRDRVNHIEDVKELKSVLAEALIS